jgi:hypothetical protein
MLDLAVKAFEIGDRGRAKVDAHQMPSRRFTSANGAVSIV